MFRLFFYYIQLCKCNEIMTNLIPMLRLRNEIIVKECPVINSRSINKSTKADQ